MNTKKYEIYTDRFKVWRLFDKDQALSKADLLDEYHGGGQLEDVFDTLEEAREKFLSSYADYGRTWLERDYGSSDYCLVCDIARLDEVEYNDEGELERFCNTWEVSLEEYVPEHSSEGPRQRTSKRRIQKMKSINEIGHKWRLTHDGKYVEIDVHNSNFRPSTTKADATAYCKLIHGNDGDYIRFRRTTWRLEED